MNRHIIPALVFSLCLIVGLFAQGCGKKQPVATNDAPAPTPASPADAAATDPASPAPAPVAQTAAPVIDPKATVADAEAALKARDYERAAATLLTIQARQQLSEQQAQAVHQRMAELQTSLASAVGSGDPKAIAAANLLRQAARH